MVQFFQRIWNKPGVNVCVAGVIGPDGTVVQCLEWNHRGWHVVELFAYLCEKYSLDPLKDGVILSHSEAHRRGIASNHGDVEHLWSRFGLSMGGFRQDIKNAITSGGVGAPIVSHQKPSIGFLVKVTASSLNYRSGPGIGFRINGQIRKNQVYTIVDEKKGWGKLKS